jgi:peptidoglycan/LPS O-acetylase OafA/YrhL
VVLSHLFELERRNFHSNYLGIFQIGHVGVDLFFVISGVVISTVTAGKFASPQNAASFLYRRLTRIYPIFWIYFGVTACAFLYNPLLINSALGHRTDFLRNFFLIPGENLNLITQAWTLTYEVDFYIVFFFLMLAVPEKLVPLCLGLWGALIVALGLLHVTMPGQHILPHFVGPLILEFLAGCVLYHVYHRVNLHPRLGKVLLGVSLLWLAGLVFWSCHFYGADTNWIEWSHWSRIVFFGPFAVLFLLGLMELERSSQLHFARPFEALGDWSYSIYLLHAIVIGLVGRPLAHMFPHSGWTVLLLAVLSVPTVVLAGALSYTWLEKPMLTFFYGRQASTMRKAA